MDFGFFCLHSFRTPIIRQFTPWCACTDYLIHILCKPRDCAVLPIIRLFHSRPPVSFWATYRRARLAPETIPATCWFVLIYYTWFIFNNFQRAIGGTACVYVYKLEYYFFSVISISGTAIHTVIATLQLQFTQLARIICSICCLNWNQSLPQRYINHLISPLSQRQAPRRGRKAGGVFPCDWLLYPHYSPNFSKSARSTCAGRCCIGNSLHNLPIHFTLP